MTNSKQSYTSWSDARSPVFGEEIDIGYGGDQFHFAQRPAGRIHTFFRQLDRQQTLAW